MHTFINQVYNIEESKKYYYNNTLKGAYLNDAEFKGKYNNHLPVGLSIYIYIYIYIYIFILKTT